MHAARNERIYKCPYITADAILITCITIEKNNSIETNNWRRFLPEQRGYVRRGYHRSVADGAKYGQARLEALTVELLSR